MDMVNRGVHAAARGGNWEILKEFVGSDSDILAYRDSYGCTVLHTAAATGQVE
ncbi:kinase D-interacting substrate of 220 kDa-like, partial [Trifolium medium]|nr:kinase D-interacting substrate of 220 kDa-like [Trifolium medium]